MCYVLDQFILIPSRRPIPPHSHQVAFDRLNPTPLRAPPSPRCTHRHCNIEPALIKTGASKPPSQPTRPRSQRANETGPTKRNTHSLLTRKTSTAAPPPIARTAPSLQPAPPLAARRRQPAAQTRRSGAAAPARTADPHSTPAGTRTTSAWRARIKSTNGA